MQNSGSHPASTIQSQILVFNHEKLGRQLSPLLAIALNLIIHDEAKNIDSLPKNSGWFHLRIQIQS